MAKILIVDDEESICKLLKQFLTKAGHQVWMALDGKQAMVLCERSSFDLIVTDIYMPEMEGLEFIQKIRKKCSFVKIIAISGGRTHTDIDFLKVARHFGADFSLQKPIDRKEFISLVDVLVADA